MQKQVILEFKPFNLILEYGQWNVLFDQVSFGISLLLAPDTTFRFLFTNTNLYEFSKYGYVDNFSFLYATRNTAILQRYWFFETSTAKVSSGMLFFFA